MAPFWRLGAFSLLTALWLLHCCSCGWSERTSGMAKGETKEQELMSHERVKRGWVWNQFFVVEEYTGTEPLYVGKIQDVLDSVKATLCEMCIPPNSGPPTKNIHTDSDEGEGNIKYTISGEGAGTIFIIDELTGDIHATERLDREQQSYYTLRAQARDRLTNHLLESESEFVIKVQDINDSEPKFLEGPYIGSVAELSQMGTSVMKVTAWDADDPTYGSSARVVYSVLDGERFFTVDRQTGLIRTAVADLDRETQDRYELVVMATDMAGQMGGLSGSTTVTIVITDVNDNPPRFPQKMYQFSVSEGAAVGTPVGRVIATDADMGENTDMSYLIKDEEGGELFRVTTDGDTQEAVITIKKPLDFESKRTHNVVVEAVNKHVDPRFLELGSFRDQTIVRVSVTDTDEPPVFLPAEGAIMEVQEDARLGALVGTATAKDPDMENAPVRFSIDRSTDQEQIFHIDPVSGAITLGKILDRETAGWHNITVTAVEADNVSQISHSSVSIRILDVNDNPPELATPYEASICEDAKPGQLIHTISVVDRDEPQSGQRFSFTLAPEATNNRHFSLWDVKDNTAGIRTQRTGFNRHEQNVYLLPILVVDTGPPALSSTGTLTIHVCGCDPDGTIQSCNATAYVISASLSPGALIALLVCMLILIVLVLLILTLKRHRKGQRMSVDEEDMRDNVIKYNDEGGGEQDTQAYDMSALRNLYDFPEAKSGSSESGHDLHALPQWIQGRVSGDGGAADFSLFKGYIRKKVEQADADLSVPPYDSFQTYAFEGTSSPALSLSSIHTLSTTSEQDFSYLSDWGPRFRQLAGYYAPGHPEEEGS
ncbi:cadherin-22-like isoform X1 [Coregonus clupeaformis]|uniref:cadherin-22-like isoform X1 n=1 Tax=Coregonus clupeaformis TaxID=59861 RepID=UPI001BE04045|nr:cadherin-22-like isoform X1 [Coregonus clupeaformis]XP_041747934.1 cadherin-22-like isoform X1 [Coregonus clupeaformis]